MYILDLILDITDPETSIVGKSEKLYGNQKAFYEISAIGGVPKMTVNDNAGVAVRIVLKDGSVIIGATTLASFLTAARALEARYGSPTPAEVHKIGREVQ